MTRDIKIELAGLLSSYLVPHEREPGDVITCTKDDAPRWAVDVMRAAHGDMLPDDWRYNRIKRVLESLTEHYSDTWEDARHDMCDSLVDVYNGSLLSWLGSHLTRAGYCDEAAEEGLVPDGSGMFQRMAIGQYRELEEIFGALINEIEGLADSGAFGFYTAGWNRPGCLPDNPPAVFAEFDDARDYIADEIRKCAEDEYATDDESRQLERTADEVAAMTAPFAETVDGSEYWVHEHEAVQADPNAL